jgi:hypothetical protein
MDNVMIIETIFSIFISVLGSGETVGTVKKVYGALNTYNKVQEMNEDEKWKASLHEEVHQIVKDAIRNGPR